MSSMKFEFILVVVMLLVVGSIPQVREFAIGLLMVMAMIAMIVVSLPAALCLSLVRRPAPPNPTSKPENAHYRRTHHREVSEAPGPSEDRNR